MKTIITLAIVAVLSAVATHAEVFTKGGATRLNKAAVVQTGTSAGSMQCGRCSSDYVKVASPSTKGSQPSVATVERHGCNSCGTKWSTVGHGKAKVEVANHTCGGCKM